MYVCVFILQQDNTQNIKPEGQQGSEALTAARNKKMYNALNTLHCVQKKNTHSHFLSYLHELFVDLNKNCSEYTQGLIDSDNVKIRYSLRSMT